MNSLLSYEVAVAKPGQLVRVPERVWGEKKWTREKFNYYN